MSTLKDFISHDMNDKPNDVHGQAGPACAPEHSTAAYQDTARSAAHDQQDGSGSLTNNARRRIQAMRGLNLRPGLFYTQQEREAKKDGVFDSKSTVEHRLVSKEEFPQG